MPKIPGMDKVLKAVTYNAGDVAVLKITGEKVYVVGFEDMGITRVRRASISENGSIQHNSETFLSDEIETLEEFGNRQIGEVIIKQKCQKMLIQAEEKMQQELEQEAMDPNIDGEVIYDATAPVVEPAEKKPTSKVVPFKSKPRVN